jgi:YidC/Oxa1 family membrane protein insertase
MDTYRAFLAIGLSFIILLGYQYFFVRSSDQGQQPPPQETIVQPEGQNPPAAQPTPSQAIQVPPVVPPAPAAIPPMPAREGRDIQIDTNLYHAVLTETGGGFKSFTLKHYREGLAPDSPRMELVETELSTELPLYFTWGGSARGQEIPLYTADRTEVQLTGDQGQEILTMKADLGTGLSITRTMIIDSSNYLLQMTMDIKNMTEQPLQGSPFLHLTNRPFSGSGTSRFLFSGAALLIDDTLEEIKVSDLEKEAESRKGRIAWAAYEGTYFMTGVIPAVQEGQSVRLTAEGDKVSTLLSTDAVMLPAQSTLRYKYSAYFGPKKLSILKKTGAQLERIVNFGWFTVIAKPTLLLLNFIHRYIPNYGVAIILVTILIKLLFWPIAQKGMKSMRNMQKIQPKITKLREKYKNDPTRMNQEMMNIYKTYKINPLGGCLPMLLQIPVFFALYKVLLQAIELRHAPFMLWITDLSAPDRLWPGLHLPYLGGIPVLTLLMGGSMFLQQKMTPSPADPTQAKIMMFLPVIFTFMFLNFASGLVLYWLVNNLLSIGQQYMINKAKDA